MAKRVLLPQDPRWLPFCERYAGSAERFAVEVQGIRLSRQQRSLFAYVSRSRSRTSVASGHGTGKTTSIANIVLWHLLCYPNSITLLTANDMDQLKATLWKEIGLALERIRLGPHSWIYDHVEVLANASCRIVGFEDTWFVESKTANEKTANKMAGRHGEWLLIIGDEASTLPDTVLTTLAGALTEKHNRMLLTSQPTRNAGFFYRTHNSRLSRKNGGDWDNLVFSSFESPWVSDEALLELWNAYDNDERRVRLLGLFPSDSSKHMMGRKTAEAMYTRGRIIADDEPHGWVVLSDIGAGEGLRDKSTVVVARVAGDGNKRRVEVVKIPLVTNKIRANVFSDRIIESGAGLENPTYATDWGGLGISVCQDLEDANVIVHRVIWGSPCENRVNKKRYLNLRAQAMHQAALAAKDGRLSILTSRHQTMMIDQASRIPKSFTGNGRICVPPKGSREWEGLGSPDLWDAVCFAFLENLHPICLHGTLVSPGDDEKTLESAAAAAFADISM